MLTLHRRRQDPAEQVAESTAASDLRLLETLVMQLSNILDAAEAAASTTAAAPDQNAVSPLCASSGGKPEYELDIHQGVKAAREDAVCLKPHAKVMRTRPVESIHAPRFRGGNIDAQVTARCTVLLSADLLGRILGYIGGGRGQVHVRRKELGIVALVCHTWRAVAESETMWEPLVKERFPRLCGESALLEVGREDLTRAGGSYRRWLLGYGQLLYERRVVIHDHWTADLTIQYDVWDENDGFCLFSHEVGFPVDGAPGYALLDEEGVGTAFNAASRRYTDDPDLPFRTMREFLQGTHGFKVRVTVCDFLTGAKAVIWDAWRSGVDTVVARGNSYEVTCHTSEVTAVGYGPACFTANIPILG